MSRSALGLAALAVSASGCGRVGFDPLAGDGGTGDGGADGASVECTTPAGHDEDTDGVDDACDVCPHKPGPQADADGDGIGDDCDLASTRQVRLLFDPFTASRGEWTYGGAAMLRGDSIYYNASGGSDQLVLVGTPGRYTYEMAGRIGAGGTGSRQISFQLPPATGSYYCELYDSGGGPGLVLNLMRSMSPMFSIIASMPIGGRLEAGEFELIVDYDPPQMACIAHWKGVRYEAAGMLPAAGPALDSYIGMNNVEAELDYFVHLDTP